MESTCEHCGESFIPKRADASYCSHSCRQQAYLARKAGEIQNFEGLIFNSTRENEMTDEKEPSLSVTDKEEIPLTIGVKTETKKFEEVKDQKRPDYYSKFLDYIDQRISYRQRDLFLARFEIQYPALSRWINTRYLCLVESLLTISEMRSVDLDDLKDICNAFSLLLNSETFKNIPVNYPYEEEMNKYHEIIRQFCISSEDEVVVLKFTRITKAELIASRFELVQLVAKVGFDQLNFNE